MLGHIYRIIHLESDVQYVGSTFNEPRKRWQDHKYAFLQWMKGNHRGTAIYPYMQEHGIDKFKLILIKSYEVVDRRHLEAYEHLYISKLSCVNKTNPFAIERLSDKLWHQNNRDRQLQNMRNYYIQNREALNAKKKEKINVIAEVNIQTGARLSIFERSSTKPGSTLNHNRSHRHPNREIPSVDPSYFFVGSR
jgi:hypothetical protein